MATIITVPDLPAAELTALLARTFEVDQLLTTWDYNRGLDGSEIPGRGRRFEVLVWTPKKSQLKTCLSFGSELGGFLGISTKEVRAHQHKLGFDGHVAAFMAWLQLQAPPRKRFATVPADNGCFLWNKEHLQVPCAEFRNDAGFVSITRLQPNWSYEFKEDGFTFVAFKMIG